jgi:hypothetical protein
VSSIIWPEHLAAIYEIVWRAKGLVTSRSPSSQWHYRNYSDAEVYVSVRNLHGVVNLALHDQVIYRGDGTNHEVYDLDLLVEGRDALRRLMVLDDLGDIR